MVQNGIGQELTVGMTVAYVAMVCKSRRMRKGVIARFITYNYRNGHTAYVPVVNSWTRRGDKYGRQLSSCEFVFPINESVEQVKEWCRTNGAW